MKKVLYIVWLTALILGSCKDDDIAVFEKTADERVAEAIATLKQDLVAPANGWRIKYRPEAESGSFYVLMDFNEDNTVTIKSDVGYNDGEFFETTVTYRIDSSLGLELIIESYSFFSFLLEQGGASFPAEYEFNYVNKTSDNALVFNSKTDLGTPTVLLFEEAAGTDENLLGKTLSPNINVMADDFRKFSSSLRLTYVNKDLALNVVMDEFRRTISFTTASRKSNSSTTQRLNFSSPYFFKGDSLVFDTRFSGTVLNNAISIKGIKFSTLTTQTLSICADPITLHGVDGVTSANDMIKLETSLLDPGGKNVAQVSDFYIGYLENIRNDGQYVGDEITQNIAGAAAMQLYYNNGGFYGIGFIIINPDGSATFALRQFTPTFDENKIVFNFEPEISIFGETDTPANTDNVNIYLDALTQGDQTYVFEIEEGVYEFYNPCTKWSFAFIDANQ